MEAAVTKLEFKKFLISTIGKQYDVDNYAGAQCFDYANLGWKRLFAHGLLGEGAADIPYNTVNLANFRKEATIYHNTPSFLAQLGDLVIFPRTFGEGYGHVAWVLEATLDYIIVLEQNWLGGGWTSGDINNGTGWEKVTKRKHAYDPNMIFIRPNFKAEAKKAAKKATTSKAANTKKPAAKAETKKKEVKVPMKKILLTAGHGGSDPGAVGNGTNERDFIRNNIVDNVAKYLKDAGHSVTIFPKQYDMLQTTFNGTKKNGLYWAKSEGFDEVIEFHLDAASPAATGGHTIVWHEFTPDKVDLGLQNALAKTVGVIRGITGRDDLGNARVAAELGVSYRLVELGFITSKKDMDYIKNNLQSFTKALAAGINGTDIVEVPKAKKKPVAKPKKAKAKKKVATTKAVKASTFRKDKNRKRSTGAYCKGTIDSFGASVRNRTGSRLTGFKFTKKAGIDLSANETVYIFETCNGWGRIYTGNSKGTGSNRWIYLERLRINQVYKN